MINHSSDHVGVAAIDASIALALVVSTVSFAHPTAGGVFGPGVQRITLVDAGFGLTFIVLWQYCFSVLQLYDRYATLPSRMSAILKGVLVMAVPLIIHLSFFHRQLLDARTIIYVVSMLFGYEVDRIAVRDFIVDRVAARDPQSIIIIGSGRRAGKAWREIRTRYYSSTKVLGFVDDRSPYEMAPDIAARHIGRVDELSDLLLAKTVDIVLIAMPLQSSYHVMQRAVTIAENVGLRVIFLNDIYATKRRAEQPNRLLFQDLLPSHEHLALRLTTKRLVDILVAGILLVVLLPFLACVALAIKATSKGPAIFCQNRFGYKRRIFQIYKFRSMVEDAEAQLAGLESRNEVSGPIFKMKLDPRVTPLGRFLRSTSIDELPQLWNVLKGEMSLVGPRPMSVRDVSLFGGSSLMRRFSVKPGITGLWQVQGRSSVGFDEWIALDTQYIEDWSLLLDIKIIWRTVAAVLKRSGAV